MLSRKLISFLNCFSKQDFILFEKYIYSPFFNESREQQQLFEVLKKYYKLPVEKQVRPKKKAIWEIIYPNKNYVDVKMRRLTSEMNRLAENFLIHRDIRRREDFRNILLLNSLKNTSLKQSFNQNYIRINNKWKEKGKDINYYFEKSSIELLKYEFEDLIAPQDNELTNLIKANENLNHYFILSKLKYYCIYLNYKAAYSLEIELELPTNFLKNVLNSDSFEEPLIKLYFFTTQLFLNIEPEKRYNAIEMYLIQYEDVLPLVELKHIYFCLQNYCALELNKGNSIYFKKLFDIYKTMIERKVLPGKEMLKPEIYKNILTLGLMVKEFDWVENFIQEYTSKLPLKYQENTVNYNLANVYFHQNKYWEVIEQLREVHYENLTYAISGKLLLLRTYYELGEIRSLDSLIDSFRVYLRRNKLISKDVRQQCMNALRFTKKVIDTPNFEKEKLSKVKTQIENCKALAIKKWLLEKVEERETKRR